MMDEREIINIAKERNKARDCMNAALRFINAPYASDDKAERFDEMEQRLRDIKEVLR
jgi:hypothetical protein